MVLMGFALIKAIINDSRRNAAGVSSTVDEDEAPLPAE
jgi:hypothetical protein